MGTVTRKAGKAGSTKKKKSKTKARPRPKTERKATRRGPQAATAPAARKAPARRRPTKKSLPTPNIVVDADVLEFIAALDAFKAQHGRPFPSWSQVLHVLRELGYRKS